jgi:hypothetical protein
MSKHGGCLICKSKEQEILISHPMGGTQSGAVCNKCLETMNRSGK